MINPISPQLELLPTLSSRYGGRRLEDLKSEAGKLGLSDEIIKIAKSLGHPRGPLGDQRDSDFTGDSFLYASGPFEMEYVSGILNFGNHQEGLFSQRVSYNGKVVYKINGSGIGTKRDLSPSQETEFQELYKRACKAEKNNSNQ